MKGNAFAKLIARAWTDADFKAKLQKTPNDALKEMGIQVPPGVSVSVLEDTADTVHLVIPSKPSAAEMSEQDLSKLSWAYESNSGPSGGSR